MKNLIFKPLVALMVFALALPGLVYADGSDVTVINTQDRIALESQLNVLQKELIVLLNKRVEMFRAEFVAQTETKIRSFQVELVGLLQKQVTLIRAQLNNQS